MFEILRRGQRYLTAWPQHAVVAAFTETKMVPLTKLATRAMPAAAVVNLLVQWQSAGQQFTPIAIATSLFMLMLPVQCLYWFGQRAATALTPQLQAWYLELDRKLSQAGAKSPRPPLKQTPTYFDLAKLLRRVLDELPPDQH